MKSLFEEMGGTYTLGADGMYYPDLELPEEEPVLLNGAVPDYYLARLQIAWHIGLLKMTVSGVIVCLIYMIIMFIIKKKLNSKTSRNSQP